MFYPRDHPNIQYCHLKEQFSVDQLYPIENWTQKDGSASQADVSGHKDRQLQNRKDRHKARDATRSSDALVPVPGPALGPALVTVLAPESRPAPVPDKP